MEYKKKDNIKDIIIILKKNMNKNKNNKGDSGYFGFMDEGERFMDDGAFDDPPDARPSDGFASARAATTARRARRF